MFKKTCYFSLLVAAIFIPAFVWSPQLVHADGEIAGRVEAEGRESRVFWVIVIPADFPQPVTLEQVRPYGVSVVDGNFRLPNLEPGRYLVALIESPSEMQRPTPTFVQVEPPDWAKADGFTDVGLWPAFEVEIKDTAPEESVAPVTVVFERKPYAQPPIDVVPPRTGADDFSIASNEKTGLFQAAGGSSWVVGLGGLILVVSLASLVISLARSFRFKTG